MTTGELERRTVEVAPGIRLSVAVGGGDGRPIVLLHGFPQTSRSWDAVVPILAAAGHRVVTLDYRGAGHSDRPPDGYDLRTMAADLDAVMRAVLGSPVGAVVVGHDIGMMIAAAHLLTHRDAVAGAVLVDAPIPGTAGFDRLRTDPRLWHFAFHATPMAELLTTGREELYVRAFIGGRLSRPGAVDAEAIGTAARAYAQPGALRAGFEIYRAFDADVADLRAELARGGRVRTPVLGVGGALSLSSPHIAEMIAEIGTDTRFAAVPDTGHWVPDEAPDALAELVLRFIDEGIDHVRAL